MAQEPKKQQPNDDVSGDDSEANLPPWLRSAPPTPTPPKPAPQESADKPVIPRLSPRQTGDDAADESVPPWLRGLQAPEEKRFKIGSMEVSSEFFDSADELADSVDSEQTFDNWLAEQVESKREKSVEEEIPDIFSEFGTESEDQPASAYPMREVTGGTSQLPDWFLGLEELDERDAPDWVRQIGTNAAPAEEAPPPEPPKADPFADFFLDLGVQESEDSFSDLDLPSEGFFSELVGKSAAPSSPADGDDDFPDLGFVTGTLNSQEVGGATRRLDDDELEAPPPPRPVSGGQTIRFDDFDDAPGSNETIRFDDLQDESFAPAAAAPASSSQSINFEDFRDELFAIEANETIRFDDFEDSESQAPTLAKPPRPEPVEIPQNELDAFLEGIGAPAPQPAPSLDDIDDPDLDLFVERREPPPPAQEQEDADAAISVGEDSLSWLSEIDSMVTAATRALDPRALDNVEAVQRDAVSFDDLPEYEDDAAESPVIRSRTSSASDAAFSWDDSSAVDPDVEAQAEESDIDWLSGIQQEDASAEAPTMRMPRPEDTGLSGLIRRARQQPTEEIPAAAPQLPASMPLPTPAAPSSDEADSLDFASLYAADDEGESPGLDSSWSIPADLAAEPAGAVPAPEFEDLFGESDDNSLSEMEAWERIVQGAAPLAEYEDDDLPGALDSDGSLEAELRSGWMTDDLLEDSLPTQPTGAAHMPEPEEDDQLEVVGSGRWDLPPSTVEDDLFDLHQAGSDTIDLGEFDVLDGGAPAFPAASAPSSEESSFDTIDFGKWDAPPPPVVGATEPQGDAEDQESDLEGVDTLDFGDWDDAAQAQPAGVSTPGSEGEGIDTIDFSGWDAIQPQSPGGEAAVGEGIETIDFGSWDTPEMRTPSAFQPSEDEEIDTLNFDDAWESAEARTPSAFQLASDEEIDTLNFDEFEEDAAPASPPPPLPATSRLKRTEELSAMFFEEAEPAEDEAETFDFPDLQSEAESPAPAPDAPAGEADGLDALNLDDWELPGGEGMVTSPEDAEALGLSDWDQPGQAAEPPRSPTDPYKTQPMHEFEMPGDDDPLFSLGDSKDIEVAATDDFMSVFGLGDESQPSRQAAADEYFELDNIFASLDSEPPIAEDDTHPQNVFATTAEPEPPAAPADEQPDFDLFAAWGVEDGEDVRASDDLFADWVAEQPAEPEDPHAPPSLEVPDTYTRKRETSSLPAIVLPSEERDEHILAAFAPEEPTPFTDVTGLAAGADWAQEFSADRSVRESAAQIDAFFHEEPAGKSDSPPFDDLDTYLESLDAEAPQLSQQTSVVFNRPDVMDIDALLSQPVEKNKEKRPGYVPPFDLSGAEGMESADLGWLEQMGASVDEVSAAAIVRQRQDRPEEELPERLRKLRKRAGQIRTEEGGSGDSLTELLPGVSAGLTAADIGRARETAAPGDEQGLQVNPTQRTRADLLRALVGVAPAPKKMTAIEMTYDSPFMEEIQSSEEIVLHPPVQTQEAVPVPAVRPRRRWRIQLDRLLIVVLLTAAVIAPFLLPALRIGGAPSADFSGSPLALAGFAAVDGLMREEAALVALEYSPAASGELDPLTQSILRHILLRGATPVVISGNPLALLRAESQFDAISADADFMARINAVQPLEQGYEFYLARFMPGGLLGLRTFSADTAALLASDLRGQASQLGIDSLDDFALIVVIADSGETLRDYTEQIAPYARAPLVAGSSYSAAPLVEPYARSGAVDGLLIGFGDGLTYDGLLTGVEAIRRSPRPVRTPLPTPAPQSEIAPVGSVELTPEVTPESTVEAAPVGAPEVTPTPLIAVVSAEQRVNLRAEPNGTIIGGLEPGTRVFVLGANDDSAWANVRLEDGTEGWVSASLLTLETPARKVRQTAEPRRQDVDVPMTNTRPPTRRASATSTPSPTASATTTPPATSTQPAASAEPSTAPSAEATAEAAVTDSPTATRRPSATPMPSDTPEPTATAVPEDMEEANTSELSVPPTPAPLTFSAGLRDERWYGINLGIIASVLVIGSGAIINIARALLRGRRRRRG
ncbi:MAG: SH3 domain-containing protein [Anaerolineae bacterium]|nr:SH3 domain-containing protein [Anaerolineae bacterium]